MSLSTQISKHYHQIHFGGNWTSVNLKDTLADVSWQQAVKQVYLLNSIAKLVFHINYYTGLILKVLQGGPLDGHDKFSFDVPPIASQEDWEKLVNKALTEAEQLTALIEHLPEEKLWEDFTDAKYGNYYRNLHGLIEHSHYHLGQIAIIKKIIQQQESEK